MSSRRLVDPELLPFLEAFPTLTTPAQTLPETRKLRGVMLAQLPPLPQSVLAEVVHVPGAPGDPDVRVGTYRKKQGAASRPAILHLHGGGYILGPPTAQPIVAGFTLGRPKPQRHNL